jgi:putative transcriptional regulator
VGRERLQNLIGSFRSANGKMTQGDLAKRVGIARQSIVAIEKGNRNPSVRLALRLAKALDAEVEDLFFFDWPAFSRQRRQVRVNPLVQLAWKEAARTDIRA